MAVVLKERPESRRIRYGVNGGGETLVFNGKGSDDSAAYYNAVLAIPNGQPGGPYWDNLALQDIEVELQGGGRAKVSVNYGDRGFAGTGSATGAPITNPTPPLGGSAVPGAMDAPLGPGYSMEITAETRHITQSIATIVKRIPGGAELADNMRAIGVTKDRVEGCDVYAPKAVWTRVAARPNVSCTLNYTNTLKSLVGKKNNALFYGRAAGEVVYMGASMAWNGRGYTFTHKFEDRDNITNQIVVPDPLDPTNPNAANAITVLAAKGWDYIWYGYKQTIRSDEIAPEPVSAFVEKVIEDADFSVLGIGA